jgi:two-component system chemotaxis sensor kinase CheA
MARDPYKYFRIEARELLDQMAQGVLTLEKAGSADQVALLLRLAHTLKGAARVVKEIGIADAAHSIEDVLIPWREKGDPLPRGEIDRLLAELDKAERGLKLLASPEAAQPKTGPARPSASAEEAPRIVRAEMAEIDTLLDGVAETHALVGGLRAASLSMEKSRHIADLLLAQLAPRPGSVLSGPQKQLFALADELRRSLTGVESALGRTLEQMERELGQLRDNAEQLRLVGAASLFTILERTARDSARALGREVSFSGTGGEIRLDAPMLEAMQHALVQIVRNAVAHGIEPPAERVRLGKPEAGRITLRIERRGGRINVTCGDDGRGLDLDAIRRAAHAPHASMAEAIRLLLKGGISTSEQVTEASGRGVGLDVVRDLMQKVGGTVEITSEAGRGANFHLSVPPSLSAVDALLVEVGGVTIGLPLDAARHCMRLLPADFVRTGTGLAILSEGTAIPFRPLADLLGIAYAAQEERWTAVVVAGDDGKAAFGIDRLLGSARLVIHPLPQEAPADAIVAGASLDAAGTPRLMLDPDRLVAAAKTGGVLAAAFSALRPVLVVDDSLTTQMLQRSILESAGYDVDLAGSAEIGLEMAKSRDYGIFLVDVEMPGMDGFSFVEKVRADPALYRTPAILVTSRAAPEDLQRGKDVGAQGYMVKSAFDQSELLSMIKRLTE